MDEIPGSWNHRYEKLNIPLIPNYQLWGGLFWGDGGETWTRKSGGWSPPTQLPSHLPLLQCYPGVLPHPTVQYITTIKLQINFRIGVVWLILVSRYSIKVAHLMHILFIYRVYINIYLIYTYMIYKQGYSVSLHLSTHLFAYWLEQMRHIEEHIQPRLSLSLSRALATCRGTKARRGCGWSTISQQIHIHRWIEATQAKNKYPIQVDFGQWWIDTFYFYFWTVWVLWINCRDWNRSKFVNVFPLPCA